MANFEQFDDVPRYRKKSTAKPPKKSKHKHLNEPCIIAYPERWWTKEHLRNAKMHTVVGAYCPVCGKIGELKDKSPWYTKDTVFVGTYQLTETVLTEDGKKEMNPLTRTLPYFEIDDPFAKFVQLSENKKGE
jgi:hypothetical protein